MPLSLQQLVKDFADALHAVDASRRTHKTFRPGIGPFGEADATKAALDILRQQNPLAYSSRETGQRGRVKPAIYEEVGSII